MISIVTAQHRDEILAALADPTRRRIVELLGEQPRTATEIHRAFPIADPAVSRHLRVLREAGLVSDHQVPGDKRVRLYNLELDALDDLSEWIDGLIHIWQTQLDSFKEYAALRATRPRDEK